MYCPVASRSDAAFAVSVDSARAWKTAEATMQDVIKPRSLFVFICAPPCCCRALRSRCEVPSRWRGISRRSEEHTSELQSRLHLVCRLLLEKKKRVPRSLRFAPLVGGHDAA